MKKAIICIFIAAALMLCACGEAKPVEYTLSGSFYISPIVEGNGNTASLRDLQPEDGEKTVAIIKTDGFFKAVAERIKADPGKYLPEGEGLPDDVKITAEELKNAVSEQVISAGFGYYLGEKGVVTLCFTSTDKRVVYPVVSALIDTVRSRLSAFGKKVEMIMTEEVSIIKN
ncbi:MAG: hypothetical protein J5793_03755 [Clostridia bacterium]|nr:hypothetical protein [Clostridia bacterium]